MAAVQALIDGLLAGGVYALISVGLTLVFGVMGVVNFAQAEFLMLGMFAAWALWAWLGLDPWLGAPLAFAGVFLLGTVLHRLLLRRVMRAPAVAQIFLTVGLLLALENLALLLFGSDFRSVRTPYQMAALHLGPFTIGVPQLGAFGASLVVGAALWWFLARTRTGWAMRATAQDPAAAQLSGVDSDGMHRLAFGLGTGLTAFGGAVILPYYTVFPAVGGQFVVLMFTAAVLGGLGSVAGAVVGGLMVGVVQSFSAMLLPLQLQNLVLFVVFIAILALRPQGLLGAQA